MWRYNWNEYDYRLPDENTIQLYDNKRFVAELTFRIEEEQLWITNLYHTEYGKTVEKADRHYDTEIFAICCYVTILRYCKVQSQACENKNQSLCSKVRKQVSDEQSKKELERIKCYGKRIENRHIRLLVQPTLRSCFGECVRYASSARTHGI